jgi:predicted nucleic acid-binding protein
MKIVVDANVIFSALISGKEIYLEIFQEHEVYIPDIVLFELLKYESRLIKKSKVKQDRFRMFIQMLFEVITVIPKFAISPINWQKAI